jgi:hypothetical protein
VHPFYKALAIQTRKELFRGLQGADFGASSRLPPQPAPEDLYFELPQAGPEEELSLSQLIRHLLCPASSGVFLSRARLGQWARDMGIPLAFGERYRLGMSLFEAAGMVERVPELLGWLLAELDTWDSAYVAWAKESPVWALYAGEWRERIASARAVFENARFVV